MTNECATAPDPIGLPTMTAMSVPVRVAALVEKLGLKLVAYLGDVNEVRSVRHWSGGTYAITNTDKIERFRMAFCAASMITLRASNGVAQAWFQGMNPILGDASPASVLRDGDIDAIGPKILAAARRFATIG